MEPLPCCLALDQAISFTLIDTEADAPVAAFDPMPEGAVLDLTALPTHLSIRANLKEEAGSVVFGLNDDSDYRTESFAPYALCGDIEGDYFDCRFALGEYVVTATSFSEQSGQGSEVAMGSISFSVVNNGNDVSGFTLVDANTNEDLFALEEGMVLDLSELPGHLNVRAEVGSNVRSVSFETSPTPYTRDEKVAPFSLFGDIDADYFGGSFATGSNTITATPFMDVAGTMKGDVFSVTFEVTGENPGSAPLVTGHHEEVVRQPETIALQDEDPSTPGTFQLEGNYPNPFNPTTTISFSVPEVSPVRLSIYDMLGREVRVLVDGNVPAGRTEVVCDAAGLPSAHTCID